MKKVYILYRSSCGTNTLFVPWLFHISFNVFVYNKSLSWTFLELKCFKRANSLSKDLTKRRFYVRIKIFHGVLS